MIRAKLDISTLYILVDGEKFKHYCAYCGKEIEPDVEIDHNDITEYFHCDCEDALKEIEIRKRLAELKQERKKLMSSFPSPKYKIEKVKVDKIVKI